MRWIFPISPIIAAHAGCGPATPRPDLRPAQPCRVVEQQDKLAGCVGQTITIRGTVSRTKIPGILGVDVDSSAHALADQLAEATGVLATYVVPADVDAGGVHTAHKSPGTYYALEVDGGLAKPHPVR